MIRIGLKFLFRSFKLKNRKFEHYVNPIPKINQIKFYSYIFFITNFTALFYLYFFTRYYLYEAAYDECYGYKLLSNKDFLDMCDTVQIKNRLRNNMY